MKKLQCLLPAVFMAMQISVMADTVSPGTQISVRIDTTIDVNQWDRGRIYSGRVARDVIARDGDVAIPAGSRAELIVRQSAPGQMVIDVESITVNRRRYVMDAAGPQFSTQEYQSGGGLVGSIIGAINGVTAQGAAIHIPTDSVLAFQLRAPLHVVDWADPGYDREGEHYHRDPDWYR
jgi:hypothetical protein